MSPTVAYFKSIRFMIRTNDHPPPHIHAVKNDCEAVIETLAGHVVRSHGFSERDLAKIVKAVLTNRDSLKGEWDAIHEE